MSTEKFLVYFFLIAFYTVYTQFSDGPERNRLEPGATVASIPAPAATPDGRVPPPR